ncbi:gag-asp_proteas domain-containing protein [Cucumis melo var. makuwa]|uniref:Gag-asp_proteas domain-containing protein n=1 Tax=Cucumis melo var. makuwa TaxID=1194695 RepID=A0A5A7U861_CUCMM|nr:gag-asp_proteas domain-containing protein [Cucumis melo var. makuwa]
MIDHQNDQCPEFKDENALRGFETNDQSSNTYNSSWRDHPNLRWGPQESTKYTYFYFLISPRYTLRRNSFKACLRPEPPKKERYVDDEILDVFKKVEVNLPLLTIIKSILRFAKCLKELCTNK